ncbi:hypothetical protein SAMN04488105_105155 [Salipiger thiooxidans]|uniref:Uncharacterized protein n=2 Tax=Salipiger thiooxidans TaxID=282683 RepID=A0A1G7E750_9RHOB|nr:hypothetical protein SAMN04488105_105155 [Salipiger thiooxidans]
MMETSEFARPSTDGPVVSNTAAEAGAGWEPPSAPLDMPRQVLENERTTFDWLSVARLFRARTRA